MYCFEVLRGSVWIYIWALSFQLAGAIILIIKYWGKTRQRIIDEYFPGNNYIGKTDNNTVILEKNRIRECACHIYDNRLSFLFIAIGYILSIFGDISGVHKVCIMFFVVLCTTALILAEKGIVIMVAKIVYKTNIELDYRQVESRADILPTDREWEEEIEKMIEE